MAILSKSAKAFAEIANGAGGFAGKRHTVAILSKLASMFAGISHTVAILSKPVRTVRESSKPVLTVLE